MISIYSLVTELQSFIGVSQETLEKASNSKITTKNNKVLRDVLKSWQSGAYDETPETMLFELETLLKNEKL